MYICYVLQTVTYPPFVKIVEVGPRDGLQNEKVCDFFDYFVNSVSIFYF